MSSDKRRKARVQGGWAAPANSVRSDNTKPGMPSVPAWTGKNASDPPRQPGRVGSASAQAANTSAGKFVFEQPTEEIVSKAKETMIEKSGVYDISTEPEGVSRIRFFTNFIEPKECEWMEEQLLNETPWIQKIENKDGKEYQQPRLTAWYGEHPYSYSGITHNANPEWTPLLRMLRDRLEEVTGYSFNSVLGNLYRDGHDHVPWHADNEPGLGTNPTIASLSFGDTRMFELRKNPPLEKRQARDYSNCEIVKLPLDAGSLLIMEGRTQEDWQHQLPREYHDRKARINLTFRVIYPVPEA